MDGEMSFERATKILDLAFRGLSVAKTRDERALLVLLGKMAAAEYRRADHG